jgi:hypothetical protein
MVLNSEQAHIAQKHPLAIAILMSLMTGEALGGPPSRGA